MSPVSSLSPGGRSSSVKGSSPVAEIVLIPTLEPPNENSEATERKSTPPTTPGRESTPGILCLCSYFVRQRTNNHAFTRMTGNIITSKFSRRWLLWFQLDLAFNLAEMYQSDGKYPLWFVQKCMLVWVYIVFKNFHLHVNVWFSCWRIIVKFGCMMSSLLCHIKAQEEETAHSLNPTRNKQEPVPELKRISSSATVTFTEPDVQTSVSPVPVAGRQLLKNGLLCSFCVVTVTSFVTVNMERKTLPENALAQQMEYVSVSRLFRLHSSTPSSNFTKFASV